MFVAKTKYLKEKRITKLTPVMRMVRQVFFFNFKWFSFSPNCRKRRKRINVTDVIEYWYCLFNH